MTRFELQPDRSTIIVHARSSMGPIDWEGRRPEGWVEVEVVDGGIDLDRPPRAELTFELERLTSGNAVYDAELMRRIDARLHPRLEIRLDRASRVGSHQRFQLDGTVSFHGVVRSLTGAVDVEMPTPGKLLVTGEKVIDIRDFHVPPPATLLLRIYPDVRVYLFAEAEEI